MTTTVDMITEKNESFTEVNTVIDIVTAYVQSRPTTNPRLPRPAALPLMAILVACCLLLNPVVMVVVVVRKSLHKPINAYICSLAFLDFLDGSIPMIGMTIAASTDRPFAATICRTIVVFDRAIAFASLVHLFLLAYDRYSAVVYPLKYSTPNRKLIIAVQIACTYVAAVVIGIALVMMFSAVLPLGGCYLSLPVYLDFAQIILTYVLIYAAVLYLYGRCVWGIWTQFYKVKPRGDNDDDNVKDQRSFRVSNLTEVGTSLTKTNTDELFNTNSASAETSTASTAVTDVWTSGQAGALPSSTTSRSQVGSTRIPAGNNSSNRRRNDLVRSLRNVGVYVAAFTILIMPYAVKKIVGLLCLLVDIANRSCKVNIPDLDVALEWCPYIHSAVHPLLFMITQREFGASCRQLLKKRHFLNF